MRTVQIGPFRLDSPLGEGGMAEVWSATHQPSGTDVALKLVRNVLADPHDVDREVAAMARLDHQAIVRIFDYGRTDAGIVTASEGRVPAGALYIAMELANGGALAERPRPRRFVDLRAIVEQVAEGLAHAHSRGIVHRDLKPENVLVFEQPGGRTLKLTDFGIAHAGDHQPHRTGVTSAGTPAFMAPELFEGRWRDYGPWTDLYALGCLVWWLTTGSTPFHGSMVELAYAHMRRDLPEYTPDVPVPDGFEAWLKVLLRKEHRSRFGCAADCVNALRALAVPDDVAADVGASVLAGPTQSFGSHASQLTLETIPPSISAAQPALRRVERPPVTAVGVPAQWPRTASTGRLLAGTGIGLLGLRPVPFVGREPERRLLWDALRQVCTQGQSRAVVLSGPRGVGKTRLASELLGTATQLGLAIAVRADFGGNAGSFEDVLRSLVHAAYGTRGLTGAELRTRLEALSRADRREHLEGLVGWLTRSGDCADPLGQTAAALAGLERRRPLLIFLDNLHQSPDAEQLVRRWLAVPDPANAALFVVAWGRSAAGKKFTTKAGDNLVTIEVEPVPSPAVRALLREQLGFRAADADELAARAGENLMFVVELLLDLARSGHLAEESGQLVLREGALTRLPESIESIWIERIHAAFGEQAKDAHRALELAAALGVSVDNEEWMAAASLAGVELRPEQLHSLFAFRLAEPEERGWRFAHGLLRDVIIRRAQAAGRAGADHLVCANVLAAQRGTEARQARHLLAAGAVGAALHPLLVAAGEATTAASSLAARALLELRFDALRRLGVSESDPRWLDTQSEEVRALLLTEAVGATEAASLSFLENARANGPDHLGLALIARARVMRLAGRLEAAETLIAEALERVVERKEHINVVRAKLVHVSLLVHRGRAAEALQVAREAQALCPPNHDLWLHCYTQIGHPAIELAENELAQECFATAAEIATRRGDFRTLGGAYLFMGEIHRKTGRYDDARDAYERSIRARLSAGHPITLALVNLALAHLAREDHRETLATVARTVESARHTQRPQWEAVAVLIRAQSLSRQQEWEPALEDARRSAAILEETEFVDPELASAWEELAVTAEEGSPLAQFASQQAVLQREKLAG